MSTKKGAVPKKLSKSNSASLSTNKPSSPHMCKTCRVSDRQDKVCCDLCRSWQHLKCADVTAEVKKRHWACVACTSKKKVQPPKATQSEIENPVSEVVVIDDSMRSQSVQEKIDTAKTGEQVIIDPVNDGQPVKDMKETPNVEEKIIAPSKSSKANSISSVVSRRTALALQRLEEEKLLREQRESDYLNQKYSLLEDDIGDEASVPDSELEREKANRVQQWSEKLPTVKTSEAEQTPIENVFSNMELLDKDQSSPLSKTRSEHQKSHVGIKRPKVSKTSLPAWLLAPSNLQSNFQRNFSNFPWSTSSFRQIATDTTKQNVSNNILPGISTPVSNPLTGHAVGPNNPAGTSSQITTVTVTSDNQQFYFGLRPSTATNAISPNPMGQTTVTASTAFSSGNIQFPPIPNSAGNHQPHQSSGHSSSDGQGMNNSQGAGVTTNYDHGSSSTYSVTNPITSSRVSSQGVNVNDNVPPRPHTTPFLFGPTSFQNQSIPVNTGVNQTSGIGNATPTGTVAATAANNTIPTQGPRLTTEQIATRHVIKKLPTFYGEAKHWQAFISAYEYSTAACGFSLVENLGRLQESLQGDAREAVGGSLFHPDSVPRAISTLKLIYGRPEAIIESLIEEVNKESSPRDNDLFSLIKFAISVQNLSASIRETGAFEHLQNPTLMNAITDKLTTQVQMNWAYYKHAVGVVDLSTLGDWLYNLASVVSGVVRKPATKSGKKEKSNNGKSTHYLNTQVEKNSKSQDTKEAGKKYKCPACKADGCTKKHHTLLHDYGKAAEAPKNESKSPTAGANPASASSAPTSVCNSQRSINNRTDIFRIVPVVLSHKDKIIRDFAYLDEGSNLTLMEDELANELELVGTPQTVCIDWAFGQSHESEESRIVSMKVSGFYHQAPNYKLSNVRTVKDLHLPSQSITSAWLERYPHFKNVPITTYETVKPRMLIGLQYSRLTVSLETIEGAWDEPIVCRTRLGWVVQGPTYHGDPQHHTKFSLNLCQCQSKDHQLHKLVKEYFSIENFGVKMDNKFLESREVQRARDILEKTTVKKNGRYESGLLWKYDQVDMPNSYDMALKRLQCLESKMMKNPQLAENLCNQISGFLEKGYIRKLSDDELQIKPDREWYLPIFPVFNPKKPEKVRIVWDAAAKVKNVSLNSLLLTGPDLLVPLVDILRRFRERLVAVLGDIGEMYHQIQIIEQDQGVQRFLWRNGDSTKKPEVYVMLVSTFGAACAPCTAQFVKNKNANEYQQQFPAAVAVITQNTYVDDLLDCCHSVEDAIKLAKDVKHINLQGGFETKNFLSNSKEVLKSIGERNVQSSNKNLNINTDLTLGTERVLGMFWNADTDSFTYSLKYTKVNQNILNGSHCPTKRELLRVLMSIFDPLGLLANFLIYPKLLLQETWRSNIEWDEQIPESLQTKWVKWISVLPEVENLRIPRLYSPKLSPGTASSIQLHVFVDGSAEAFSTAAYLRIQDDDGIDCSLVGAKTKVAPNKPMTIPRLELQAGVLGTRLARSIKQSQRLQIEKVIYWSDSKTVMGWIYSDTRRYHQFVAFRIGEILETTDKAEWRWVPTEHNVADEATKSKEIQKLNSQSRWFKGPDFLYDEESTWFTEDNQEDHHTREELRLSIVMACRQGQERCIIDVKRFSQWKRLVNAMAYIYRFIHNLKSVERRSGPLLQEEIVCAENQLYRIAQQDYYLDEIALLEKNAKLPPKDQKYFEKSSPLYKSSPYLDDHGVLRVRGRLDAAKCLNLETKRPIILPRRHYITKLICAHFHRRYLHLNHETAINEIRQKYDIKALRVVMKEIRFSCQKCKNDSAVPMIPEMAELPFARLAAFERPFTYVGIDYFGPYSVKITRNISASRWGVIYSCLTARAIHLEVAHSLNTSSCIMAFERFCTDRGHPREVFSDNGLNFHGMENELKEEFKKLNQDEIQQMFTTSEMKWSFNPPESPHMGGAWERLIQTVKKSFKKIVTTRKPTDETLPTLFAQVENIVNSRPLTYIPLDSADDEALTPNHFLFGSSNGRKPIVRTSPKDLGKEDWKNIEEQTNQFWRRFVLEYMPTLTKRTKWYKNSKPIQVGDVVLIIDEKNPRNTWPKGIVERTIRGRGGKCRQAIVRAVLESKNGPVHREYRRSVHKLAVLDVKVPASEEVNRQPEESINGGEPVGQH
ncbi:uncharacterized protein LOC119077203 [Bradysia coprophila]|uniref:uncharacterized protein LOC119077203 n=1 Tax=Bradysia coprophila TaxID=38358 RepID=UPI00187DAAB3|nr:uncharacterized protein LOC119077203 [Bradysia coprophila]